MEGGDIINKKEQEDIIAYAAAMSEISTKKANITHILLGVSISMNVISLLLQLFQ